MSRKSVHKRKSYRQYLRETIKSGFGFDANGNKMILKSSGDGRGMAEQLVAGYRLPPYDRKKKLTNTQGAAA